MKLQTVKPDQTAPLSCLKRGKQIWLSGFALPVPILRIFNVYKIILSKNTPHMKQHIVMLSMTCVFQ